MGIYAKNKLFALKLLFANYSENLAGFRSFLCGSRHRQVNVPANRISQIISGKRSITTDTALRLGKWFGTGPKIWLNLQQAYDLDIAKLQLTKDLEDIKPRVAA